MTASQIHLGMLRPGLTEATRMKEQKDRRTVRPGLPSRIRRREEPASALDRPNAGPGMTGRPVGIRQKYKQGG
jgi:hypothetical protein